MTFRSRSVDEVTAELTRDMQRFDPVWCTRRGFPPADRARLTDLSPAGFSQRVDMYRRHWDEMRRTRTRKSGSAGHDETILRAFVLYRTMINGQDSASERVRLGATDSPLAELFQSFNDVPNRQHLAERLAGMPDVLNGLQQTLLEDVRTKYRPSPTQVRIARSQIAHAFLPGIVRLGVGHNAVAAHGAAMALRQFDRFLQQEIAPRVRDVSFRIGEERYQRAVMRQLGLRAHTSFDIDAAYLEAWERLHADEELKRLGSQICPEGSLADLVAHLDATSNHHARKVFWDVMSQKAHALTYAGNGVVFTVPPDHDTLMVSVPTREGLPGYSPPAGDKARGTMIWPLPERVTSVPAWRTTAAAVHEVAHDIQTSRVRRRTRPSLHSHDYTAGTSEGGAEYAVQSFAERWPQMYPDEQRMPVAKRVDFLLRQRLVDIRVVLDIGLNASKRIPLSSAFHPGEIWTPNLAAMFLADCAAMPLALAWAEIDRYLCEPAQAIAYHVGSQMYRERRNAEDDFDDVAFYDHILDEGPMALGDVWLTDRRFGRNPELQLLPGLGCPSI